MIRDIIIVIISIAFGFVLSRMISHYEIHKLKEQLFASEDDNEKIVRDNANLVRENSALKTKIKEMEPPEDENTPDFGMW